MADNQIKVSVNLDSKEFDNNFKRIMNQLNEMRKASSEISRDMGNLGGGGPNSGNFDKSLKNLQTTLSNITDRTNTFDKSLKSLSQTLDDLSNKAQAAATSTTQAATAQQQQTTTQPQAPAPAAAGGGGGGPVTPGAGGPGGGGPGGGLSGILNQVSSLSKILGTIGTAVTTGGQLYKQVTTYPERIAQREATMADMMSESARLQQQRRGYEMTLFGPERAKALERASERVKGEKATDVTGLIGTVATGAAGGALMGGPLGALIGGGMAFGGAMLNDRKRSMLFDREGYQKEMGAVFAGTYKEQLATERAKSFEKDLAAQFLEKESGRFRGLQRGFGLSDQELFMGDQSIFGKLTGKGQRYQMEDITEAMQGISAAGGTKGIATGEGLQTSLQMQRNLGLTNAPQLMGRISGVTGMGAEGSKEQIFQMFAEASRAKLELPESRQFMEAATGIGYRTGGDLDTITGLLSAGVQGTGLQSARGIEAAQSAFEQFRQRTGETGGLTGQYKLAGLFGMGLDLEQAAYISNLPIDQISEDNPIVAKIAKEKGKSVEELKKEMTKSTFRTAATEKAAVEYGEAKQTFEMLKPGEEGYEEAKNKMEEKKYKFALKRNVERLLPQNKLEAQAELDIEAAAMTGDKEGLKKAQDQLEKIRKQYEQKPEGIVEQKGMSEAADAAGQLSLLEEKAGELATAFSANEGLTAKANAAAQALANLNTILNTITDPKKRAEAAGEVQNIAKNTEETGGKPAGEVKTDAKGSPSGKR
jgi:hypothetical protein